MNTTSAVSADGCADDAVLRVMYSDVDTQPAKGSASSRATPIINRFIRPSPGLVRFRAVSPTGSEA
jgi:hypothetical protein